MRTIFLIFLFNIVFTITCQAADTQTFNEKAAIFVKTATTYCRATDLVINKIYHEGNNTIIVLKNTFNNDGCWVAFYPPGRSKAFYARSTKNKKKTYDLQKIEGAPIWPDFGSSVKGKVAYIKLTFNRIKLKKIHLYEGKHKTFHTMFYFKNVLVDQD